MRRELSCFLLIVASLFLLSGCATPTPYAPRGFSGGYEEQQIDETTYRVAFFGNGVTSEEKVWNFWIHRCAELTLQKGFTYFTLSKEQKISDLPRKAFSRTRFRSNDSGRLIKVRGGGGGSGGGRGYVPNYYSSPGTVVTRYTGSALVKMYKDPLPFLVRSAFKAQAVLDLLGPYVKSDGKLEVPGRDAIIRATVFSRFDASSPANRATTDEGEPQAASAPSVIATPAVSVGPKAPPGTQAPRHGLDPNPQVGDTWTYRYSNGYGRTETYKVRLTSSSAGEIEDEIIIGQGRQAFIFGPDPELVARSISGLSLREFSPYQQSLGPAENSAAWRSLQLFEESKPFQARFAGTEVINVPAGRFEAKKLIIEGTQFARSSFIAALSRDYKVTVWYSPDVKRFIKMTISAPAMGMASSFYGAEKDVIELLETNVVFSPGKPAVSGSTD